MDVPMLHDLPRFFVYSSASRGSARPPPPRDTGCGSNPPRYEGRSQILFTLDKNGQLTGTIERREEFAFP